MPRFKLSEVYVWLVAAVGLGLLAITTVVQAPHYLHAGNEYLLIDGAVLLARRPPDALFAGRSIHQAKG